MSKFAMHIKMVNIVNGSDKGNIYIIEDLST